jgi:hypothetical protein
MRRLSHAGFKEPFVRRAILPDWWDEACQNDPNLLPDIEARVARFLQLSLSAVRETSIALKPPSYPGAQLRRARNVERERLIPAIHTATQIASAVLRNLRQPSAAVQMPPLEGRTWRNEIQQNRAPNAVVRLDDVISDLWKKNIPVVPVDFLPAPSFQGLACIIGDRPVILLGQKHDAPGRLAFFIAHEVGHIASGDCTPDQPIIDEDELVVDDTSTEIKAEAYAVEALFGGIDVAEIDAGDYKELAKRAIEIERSDGIDAGATIFRWAAKTSDYALASLAVQALYRASGARRLLRRAFDEYVDVESATESDRSLLLCIFESPSGNPSSH